MLDEQTENPLRNRNDWLAVDMKTKLLNMEDHSFKSEDLIVIEGGSKSGHKLVEVIALSCLERG